MLYTEERYINHPVLVWEYHERIGQSEYQTLDLTQVIKTELRIVSLRTKHYLVQLSFYLKYDLLIKHWHKRQWKIQDAK